MARPQLLLCFRVIVGLSYKSVLFDVEKLIAREVMLYEFLVLVERQVFIDFMIT
jgi:hypothetical protein